MKTATWVKKFKKKGIEIKKFGNRYYAYKITSVWDKKKKKPKKITKYLGTVTPKGIIKVRKESVPLGIYEYGNISLLYELSHHLIEIIKENYPYNWEEIITFSVLRVIRPTSLRSVKYHYEKTYLSQLLPELHLSSKSLINLLKDVGADQYSKEKVMERLTEKGQYLLFDLMSILSYSKNIHWLERGYNKNHSFLPQINIAMFFSYDKNIPTFIKLLPGSVRDINSLINAVEESTIQNVILILDRGFYSKTNIVHLNKRKIQYIIPLKRNSKLIKSNIKKWNGFFFYKKRHIKFVSYKRGKKHIHIFEDVRLKYEEETIYHELIEKGKKTMEKLKEDQKKFGKITFITNTPLSSKDVYLMFKHRENIEYSFNIFKNVLEVDKNYLQDTTALDGYVFLNFLSLYIYFLALNLIKEKDLQKKYSLKDVLLQLSKVYIVKYDGKEIVSEVPKQVRMLIEGIGQNLFPKIRRI